MHLESLCQSGSTGSTTMTAASQSGISITTATAIYGSAQALPVFTDTTHPPHRQPGQDSFTSYSEGLPQKALYITDITESPDPDILLVGTNSGLFNFDLNEERFDIAYEYGFSAPSYFSKCFKELFGLTPADYRKKNGEVR